MKSPRPSFDADIGPRKRFVEMREPSGATRVPVQSGMISASVAPTMRRSATALLMFDRANAA
jgi:hypothetical protein